MIGKIKAEIEELQKSKSHLRLSKGMRMSRTTFVLIEQKIDTLKQCLKWAEELEKELKEQFEYYRMNVCGTNEVDIVNALELDIEKAFHKELSK